MENKELINKYELVVIVDAKKTSEEKEAAIAGVKDVVTKAGATVHNSQVWLEKQKFAFEIKKNTDGTYYLINFDATGDMIEPIEVKLRLDEKILRYAITRNEARESADSSK